MKKVEVITEKQVDQQLEKLIKLDQQAKAIAKQIKIIKDNLKSIMDNNGLEKLTGNKLYCYYMDITRQVVDTNKLKQDNLYNLYLKDSYSKQFNYNVIK